MQTVLLRLFISCFPLFLFSATITIKGDFEAYSDKLKFDIFDHKWNNIPSDRPLNRAFVFGDSSLSFENEDVFFGISYAIVGNVKINKGFIETWYYAENDFNTLLKKSDVGYYITDPEIYGKMNYAKFQSFFIGKNFNDFQIKLSFLKGKVLQYMDVKGSNLKNRFLMDLKYYYNDKNILMDIYPKSYETKSNGISINIEYKKDFGNYNFFIGAYNLFGFIRWYDVMLMQYHFDSNTKYIGDDGYYHYRPFGSGEFIKTNFFQKLPFFLKYNIAKSKKNIFYGINGTYSNNEVFNEMFVGYDKFKIGYVIESKNFIIGYINKNFEIDISDTLKVSSRLIKIKFKINF